MAYKVRKSSRITEDIELIGENGKVSRKFEMGIVKPAIFAGFLLPVGLK